MVGLTKSIIITKPCWEKVKEISEKESLHMYEVIEELVDQYYSQMEVK